MAYEVSDERIDAIVSLMHKMAGPDHDGGFTVMLSDLASCLKELRTWRKLKDPQILHVNLLRGLPSQLDRETFLHLAGGCRCGGAKE